MENGCEAFIWSEMVLRFRVCSSLRVADIYLCKKMGYCTHVADMRGIRHHVTHVVAPPSVLSTLACVLFRTWPFTNHNVTWLLHNQAHSQRRRRDQDITPVTILRMRPFQASDRCLPLADTAHHKRPGQQTHSEARHQ